MDGLSIAASLVEIAPQVSDCIIRTIYQPDKGQFILRLFSGKDIRLVIDLSEASVRITTRDVENPAKPSAFVMLLRKHLRGGRIIALSQFGWDRVIIMDVLQRAGAEWLSYQLIAELVGTRGNMHLLKDGILVKSLRTDRRNSIGRSYVGLPAQDKCDPRRVRPTQLERWFADQNPAEALARRIDGIGRQTAADLVSESTSDDLALELSARLQTLLEFVRSPQPHITTDESRATFYPLPPPAIPTAGYQEALDRVKIRVMQENMPPQDTLLRDLRRAVRARERTIEKLLEWLENSTQADVWQTQADLLMTFQSEIPRGQETVVLTNPVDETTVTISLDRSLTAIENAQSLYKRAKRIRRGHPHVHHRLKRSRQDLDQLQTALEARQRGDAVESNILELLPSRRNRQQPPPKKAIPFRQFEADGFHIWMGKSARQNDALLRAASPNDIWMHAKNYAGSHVIIRARGQDRVPDTVLQSAARLAALNSKAKTERYVEVTITRVKNVRKPKGAPAGLVSVRETDTLTVKLTQGEV